MSTDNLRNLLVLGSKHLPTLCISSCVDHYTQNWQTPSLLISAALSGLHHIILALEANLHVKAMIHLQSMRLCTDPQLILCKRDAMNYRCPWYYVTECKCIMKYAHTQITKSKYKTRNRHTLYNSLYPAMVIDDLCQRTRRLSPPLPKKMEATCRRGINNVELKCKQHSHDPTCFSHQS